MLYVTWSVVTRKLPGFISRFILFNTALVSSAASLMLAPHRCIQSVLHAAKLFKHSSKQSWKRRWELVCQNTRCVFWVGGIYFFEHPRNISVFESYSALFLLNTRPMILVRLIRNKPNIRKACWSQICFAKHYAITKARITTSSFLPQLLRIKSFQ